MKKLAVHYCGWGEDWPLGHLADDGRTLLFEYTPEALVQGLELSPLRLSLRTQAYGGFPAYLHRLPGLIADSLPDGWGLLLMDRLFRKQGLPHPSPLDRLAFIGERAIGGLRFVPAKDLGHDPPGWDLLTLAHECERTLAGEAADVLQELAITGGSPQGARPKALVWYDAATGQVSTHPEGPGEPWLIKFPSQGEHAEVCAIEQLYAELARDCGLEMPASKLFELSPKMAAFGVKRFDRENGLRVPVHSLAGLLHADFRLAGSVDYTAFLRATRALTRDAQEVKKAYARAVLNVLFHNRDDHAKNFAWILGQDRRWKLAPAFDLTFSDGPAGQHHMDICGEGKVVTREHLLSLAKSGDVAQKDAVAVIDRMLDQVSGFLQKAAAFPLRKTTLAQLRQKITSTERRLM